MTTVLEDPLKNFTNFSLTSGTLPTFPSGRTGLCMHSVAAAAGDFTYTIPAPSESDTIVFGFAFKVDALGNTTNFVSLLSDAGATLHTSLSLSASGQINVVRSTSIVLATSTATVTAATWQFIEAKLKLGDTGVGSWQVRLNNTSVLGPTTGDTKQAGTKTVYDRFRLRGNSGVTRSFDDLYVLSGSAETFRGDTTISEGVNVKAWNGSSFADAPIKAWNGSSFVDAVAVKTWNGSSFV